MQMCHAVQRDSDKSIFSEVKMLPRGPHTVTTTFQLRKKPSSASTSAAGQWTTHSLYNCEESDLSISVSK